MGLIANVVPNAPIASAWGNAIRDRTIQQFASAAERDSQWPAPPVGATCYITATGEVLHYYGAGPGWRPPWNLPWGAIVAPAQITVASGSIATDVPGLSITFTAVAGRRYRITAFTRNLNLSSASTCDWNVAKAGAIIQTKLVGTAALGAGALPCGACVALDTPAAGPVTYTARISGISAVCFASPTAPAYIAAEDIGPVAGSSPATLEELPAPETQPAT